MLAATTLSIERLGTFLDDVTDWMIADMPKRGAGQIAIRDAKGKHDPRAHLFALFDAAQAIRAVVSGEEGTDAHWQDDPETDIPEYSKVWRDGTAYEYGIVARALDEDFPLITSDIRRLPSEVRLTARLRDAACQAFEDLKMTARAAASNNPAADTKEHRAVVRALIALHTAATVQRANWTQWCKAAEQVYSAITAWMRQPWTDGHGNSTNQDLRRQLLTDLAYVRQYALLMRAADRRYRMLLRLDAVLALARECGKCSVKMAGAYDAPPPRKMREVFKADLVEPFFREQWATLPSSLQRKANQLIAIVLKGGQRNPWLIGKYVTLFVRQGLVGGSNAATQQRRLVSELLAPMQAVGLAAKVPWEDLLAVPPSKKSKSRTRRESDWAAKMSNGYHGRFWVVNPFGHRLRVD